MVEVAVEPTTLIELEPGSAPAPAPVTPAPPTQTPSTPARIKIPGALAIFVTLGFFGLMFLTALHAPPPQSEKVLDVMTGSLGTAWVAVIMYYFGSSAGSDRKTEIMANGAAGGIK
jgi:hypothetical protein